MGSPRRQRKKFSKPSHPWQKERILAEKEILQGYGLNRKYEIWKINTILKNFTRQAKNLVTTKNPQVEKEKGQLLTKLTSLGLLGKDAKIEDVLSLTLNNIMERRLQTLVYRKNMASTFKQARQFIVHEHISVGDKMIKAPSYLVPLEEENHIQFAQGSIISNASHSIRSVIEEQKKIKKSKEKKESKEEVKEKVEDKKEMEGKKEKKKVLTAHDLKKHKEDENTKKSKEETNKDSNKKSEKK